MLRKKILVIIGTRPEATKMGSVINELKRKSDLFETVVIVTGQHREQLYQALNDFNIKPNYDLKIMKTQQTVSYITAEAISLLNPLVDELKPDLILVHGDTQTTLSASLTAYFNKVPIGHIEAGLRTYNKYSPWPEEGNRKITDSIADIMFAPTLNSKKNLLKEGCNPNNIFITGQTAVDAALNTFKPQYKFKEERLNEIVNHKRLPIITITAHRRENYGESMTNIFKAINRISKQFSEHMIIYPVHLSPYIRDLASSILSDQNNIFLIEPLVYMDMINLIARSKLIMSDSGGIQEEAAVFNIPLVLMRDTTERPEAVDAGKIVVSGTDEERIYKITKQLLVDKSIYNKMVNAPNPFGDGYASQRIIQILEHYFKLNAKLPEEFVL
ncbi:non-hydrolyzing UDP-N-acetylglucosamine 2-epimerase [Rummeliibacillus stabekisii]|uniref:UDP-N-acetylglucosamine 2-epimerase (non-hydrolyzing) n=1 Tax=Rummeliibacillus stabekisii TaxID=241244 RepID=A0A143HDF8_9BACL|nr:UDP-N-acetylglucosamine 2-epimerase (non-hydrolyzing) [Rummeliibacillus stabekisii]AMW99774.1 UDP-N-acetyl glucosamine 2-epimerase [Rummeliibacillus stabekisii]